MQVEKLDGGRRYCAVSKQNKALGRGMRTRQGDGGSREADKVQWTMRVLSEDEDVVH